MKGLIMSTKGVNNNAVEKIFFQVSYEKNTMGI